METLRIWYSLCSGAISSAHHLLVQVPLGYTASRNSHQPLFSDGARKCPPQWLGAVIQHLSCVWENQALRQAKFLVWGSKSDQSVHEQVLCSECAPDLVLQVSKAAVGITIWALQVWAHSSKISMMVAASPSPFLCHKFLVTEPWRFSWNPHGVRSG